MPFTSAAVERVFSVFKAMNRDNRQCFIFDNLRKFVITKCILQKVCFSYSLSIRLCNQLDYAVSMIYRPKIWCHLQKFKLPKIRQTWSSTLSLVCQYVHFFNQQMNLLHSFCALFSRCSVDDSRVWQKYFFLDHLIHLTCYRKILIRLLLWAIILKNGVGIPNFSQINCCQKSKIIQIGLIIFQNQAILNWKLCRKQLSISCCYIPLHSKTLKKCL